jgi:uncharacterized protein YeaO (DUF488 family)
MHDVTIKRIYDPPSASDGRRILVDRLWPRGVKKSAARLDEWIKDLAPSDELRRWFGHEPERWPEFRRRYQSELKAHAQGLAALRDMAEAAPVTLLYAARDRDRNEARVLADLIEACDS